MSGFDERVDFGVQHGVSPGPWMIDVRQAMARMPAPAKGTRRLPMTERNRRRVELEDPSGTRRDWIVGGEMLGCGDCRAHFDEPHRQGCPRYAPPQWAPAEPRR